MKNYDLSYSFRDDLRTWANNPEDMKKYAEDELSALVNIADENLSTEQASDLCKRLGELAHYLKTLRQTKDALLLLNRNEALIQKHALGLKTHLVNELRRADVLRYDDDYEEARHIFLNCLEQTRHINDVAAYRDFALQHLGKLYFDLGEFNSALDCFYEALEIRKIKADPELLDSTLLAIRITESKI